MKIGILQTGHVPDNMVNEHGEYGTMFTKFLDGHGFEFDIYSVVDGVFPDDCHAADGWLITGSKHGAYEDHAWIPPLEEFIRAAYSANTPIVGVCFGHQIIAQALGGRVEKFAKGWSVGPVNYEFDGFDGPTPLHAWHQDQVVDIPSDAQVIGRSDFCENAMLIYGKKALSVQPHPEFNDDFVKGLIETRGPGVVPDDLLQAAGSKIGGPIAQQALANRFADFFKQER